MMRLWITVDVGMKIPSFSKKLGICSIVWATPACAPKALPLHTELPRTCILNHIRLLLRTIKKKREHIEEIAPQNYLLCCLIAGN